jgi:hypothetical protein
MANTYSLISSSTVGSGGAGSITFSSIPQTYTDLLIKFSGRESTTEQNVGLSFNGSSSNFSSKLLYGNGSTAATASYTDSRALNSNYSSAMANAFSNGEVYISDYTTSKYKTYQSETVQEDNISNPVYLFLYGGMWSSTAAITSITLTATSSTFVQYTTAYLYGIKNS